MEIDKNNKDNFEKVIRKINKLSGDSEIRFKDIFTKEFMIKYTTFNSINQMFRESDFQILRGEDFNNISENELDGYVSETTDFSDWDEMIEKAITEWVEGKK